MYVVAVARWEASVGECEGQRCAGGGARGVVAERAGAGGDILDNLELLP